MSAEQLLKDIREDDKRAAVLTALTVAASKGLLGVAAAIHGVPEYKLARCVQDADLGTLSQAEIDWLAIDLEK